MLDIFCKIVAGEIPAHKVYEDDKYLAFLEINPIRLGHTILIPKEHYSTVYEIPDGLYAEYFLKAKELSTAVKTAAGAEKCGLVVAGFDLDHAHIHLLPMDTTEDIDFHNQHEETQANLATMADKIRGLVAA